MDIYTSTPLLITVELSNTGKEAKQYYMSKCPDRSMRNKWAQKILDQGATDFDKKFYPDDAAEKAHYKTDYYMSNYLYMHFQHNLSALQYCFKNKVPQSSLFVDFGCGPMTAGLALAEILSEKTSENKMQTSYFGIDASSNMVTKANSINAEYNLFAPEHFKIVQDTGFDSRKIPQSFPDAHTVVLWLSFVLAPGTYKSGDIRKLANKWKSFVNNQQECESVLIIYINPKSTESYFLHDNWRLFREIILEQSNDNKFDYSALGFSQLPVESLGSQISIEIILGERK